MADSVNITRRTALTAIAAIPVAGQAMAAPVDPMLEIISEYRRQVAAFAAIPDDVLTKENEPRYVAATYEPAQDTLLSAAPETTSIAGVREAIRLVLQEHGLCCTISENVLRSALAYLDGIA